MVPAANAHDGCKSTITSALYWNGRRITIWVVGFNYAMYNNGPSYKESKELARVKTSSKTVSRQRPVARTAELSSGSTGRPVKKMGAHGVQSAETLLTVLSAFVGAEPTPMLKTLAERTEM